MQSKYQGIDSRQIKCCSENTNSIEAGISFDYDDEKNVNILRFHFLSYIKVENNLPILHQETKSMHLNKENTKELIAALKQLKFKK